MQRLGSRKWGAERGVQSAGFGVQRVGAGFEEQGAGNRRQSEGRRVQVLECRPVAWHGAVLQGGSHRRRTLHAWGWHSCRSHLCPAATPHPHLPAPPWRSSGLRLTRPAQPCPGRLHCPCQPCRPHAKPGAAPHHCCTHPSTMHGTQAHLQLPGIMPPAQPLPHCHLPACLCSPGLPEGHHCLLEPCMPGTTARYGRSRGWHSTRWATAGPHSWAEAPFRVKGITGRKSSILHPAAWYPQPQGQAVKGTSQGLLELLIFALNLRNPSGSGAALRLPLPTQAAKPLPLAPAGVSADESRSAATDMRSPPGVPQDVKQTGPALIPAVEES